MGCVESRKTDKETQTGESEAKNPLEAPRRVIMVCRETQTMSFRELSYSPPPALSPALSDLSNSPVVVMIETINAFSEILHNIAHTLSGNLKRSLTLDDAILRSGFRPSDRLMPPSAEEPDVYHYLANDCASESFFWDIYTGKWFPLRYPITSVLYRPSRWQGQMTTHEDLARRLTEDALFCYGKEYHALATAEVLTILADWRYAQLEKYKYVIEHPLPRDETGLVEWFKEML